MDRVLEPHAFRLAGPGSGRRSSSYLGVVAHEAAALPGRPYPPPARREPKWPAQLTIAVAIALQLVLPPKLTPGPTWLVPSLEVILSIGLLTLTPMHLCEHEPRRRALALSLIALVSAANIFSLIALTDNLLRHHVSNGPELVGSGVLIWLTNFLIFGLWYWDMDRGGPGRRAEGADGSPDFLFPQMNDDRILQPDWRPGFIDYMYVSLTNAAAFSPTDTMPLSATAKCVMGLQSIVSLVTLGLIVSRAINIL